MLAARLVNSMFGRVTFEVLWSDCCTFFQVKLVFAIPSFLHCASCCLVGYGVDHVAIFGVLPYTLIKTEDHRSPMGLAECTLVG